MNIKKVSLLLILATLFDFSLVANAGNPKEKTRSEKPKQKIQTYCTVPGIYKEITSGDQTYYVCYLLSAADCISVPCHVVPYGNGKVKQQTVPPGIELEEGQNFIVKHNQDGSKTMQLVNELQVEQTEGAFIVRFN